MYGRYARRVRRSLKLNLTLTVLPPLLANLQQGGQWLRCWLLTRCFIRSTCCLNLRAYLSRMPLAEHNISLLVRRIEVWLDIE